MRKEPQRIRLIDPIPEEQLLAKIEKAGRTCYQSEAKGDPKEFIKRLIEKEHLSVLEHGSVTFEAVTTRALANQLVRHRIASYSQESTRYCNYSKGKFEGEIAVIKPTRLEGKAYLIWAEAMKTAEKAYIELIQEGTPPEVARGILPLDTKTSIVVTMNFRALREFLQKRLHKDAQQEMQTLAKVLLAELIWEYPTIFKDLEGK